MNKLNWNKVSNWLLALGVLAGGLGYYNIYKIKSELPPGVCPINNNRSLLFISIFLLVLSIVTSFINDRVSKKCK